ncbi:unnamed protein product [Fusarium graminearum]|uniref:Chromosome 4, complete genome n=2 Tax=Gibberella zeae TaxID=5518 RepID=I1RYK3_GIBZE|nr:hypothetical protein FGSG_09459 [Fusarium graminearum PH-1]EYB31103.1 hypothetical protein FG05_09459 [Fusarium graminearum]ESU16049.1 hypothetical protein FGSG_09459 [Fusarium graminearum PH-1]KAI6768978.1 hypothetical protein HG531_010082 [Fusarium graminearum]PCD17689.1 hypothetical protein FGRA07_07157 [Fusarium graminearum]CAF3505791.1 unnamed protein product [Fusarium graminearum]|eukprot:XP_011328267.1 hypothetical protein FGSG_09459 [Fusarium graminearum PH-1]
MVDTKFRLTESPGQVQNSRELNNALMTEKVRAHFLKEALGKASGEIQDLVNKNRKLSTKLEAKENENKKLSAELKALKKERKHDFGATSDLDLRMMMRLDELRYEEEALKNTFVASNEKFEDNIANNKRKISAQEKNIDINKEIIVSLTDDLYEKSADVAAAVKKLEEDVAVLNEWMKGVKLAEQNPQPVWMNGLGLAEDNCQAMWMNGLGLAEGNHQVKSAPDISAARLKQLKQLMRSVRSV